MSASISAASFALDFRLFLRYALSPGDRDLNRLCISAISAARLSNSACLTSIWAWVAGSAGLLRLTYSSCNLRVTSSADTSNGAWSGSSGTGATGTMGSCGIASMEPSPCWVPGELGGAPGPRTAPTVPAVIAPTAASLAAAPNTPWNAGVSIPSRWRATLEAYCSCPACAPSSGTSPAIAVPTRGNKLALALAAPALLNKLSTPNRAPAAPNIAPAAMFRKFSPRVSCALTARASASSGLTRWRISSAFTLS